MTRRHVAEAQGEERGAAHVEVGEEAGRVVRPVQRRSERPVQQGKAAYQPHGPGGEQAQQRQRAEDAQEGFAALAGAQPPSSRHSRQCR